MKLTLTVLFVLANLSVCFAQDSTSKGKISGYMFSDYYYNAERDTFSTLKNVAYGGQKGQNGFQFRRIYFTYDYNISKKFTTRFRLEGAQDETFKNGKVGVFIKDAYLEWKNIFKGSNLIVGIQPTIAYTATEQIWGHRYIERTIMDLRGIVDSRDFGISLNGSFDEQHKVTYGVMLGNNSGVTVETDKYKRVYAHLGFNPVKELYITLFSDYRAHPGGYELGGIKLNYDEYTQAVMIGYKNDKTFSAGIESFYNYTQNWYRSFGLSFFASTIFSDQLSAFGRYDYFDNDITEGHNSDTRNLFLAGLDFKPDKNVIISPNVAIETYADLYDGTKIKPSITPRITLFYTFY
ncbi:MAG: hypothetical protein JST55_01460 [Bacteroidetes bacterium]|nr:hypothetical protein [Bacteroidota bacterium]